jgi:hypothetical protein
MASRMRLLAFLAIVSAFALQSPADVRAIQRLSMGSGAMNPSSDIETLKNTFPVIQPSAPFRMIAVT